MKRTVEYLKNLKEDVTHSVEDEYSNSITVGENDLKHIDEALKNVITIQNELLNAINQIHELQAFKNHAKFLLTEKQFEYLERETELHLLREKADV